LSTAHPYTFPKAIEDATSKTEKFSDSRRCVNDRLQTFDIQSNYIEKVKNYVINSI